MDCRAFHDALHGVIVLHPVCLSIIDTIEFQRLRKLKQLGNASLVFHSATHTRFEHSLGVAYLARRLVRVLADAQPELCITPIEMLCVEMAALLHDIGHGIMSHMFDSIFIPRVTNEPWSHEDAAVPMIRAICDNNPSVKTALDKYSVGQSELNYVARLINGEFKDAPDRAFLADIVSNRRNGNDVDKWDYIQRDAKMLGVSIPFSHERLLHFARVVTVNGYTTIAYPEKLRLDVHALFVARTMLHEMAYKHRVTRALDHMTVDALVLADPHFIVNGCTMSKTIHSMKAFTAMTDCILDHIQYSSDECLQPARDILIRIQERRLYECVYEKTMYTDEELSDFYDHAKRFEDHIVDVCEFDGGNNTTFFRIDKLSGERHIVGTREPTTWKFVGRIYARCVYPPNK